MFPKEYFQPLSNYLAFGFADKYKTKVGVTTKHDYVIGRDVISHIFIVLAKDLYLDAAGVFQNPVERVGNGILNFYTLDVKAARKFAAIMGRTATLPAEKSKVTQLLKNYVVHLCTEREPFTNAAFVRGPQALTSNDPRITVKALWMQRGNMTEHFLTNSLLLLDPCNIIIDKSLGFIECDATKLHTKPSETHFGVALAPRTKRS